MEIWLKWLLWGVVVVAVGFINPGLDHPIIAALSFDETWKTLILEYRSSTMYLKDIAIYILLLISLVTVFMVGLKKQFGLLIVCIVLGYNALTVSRMVAPGGIVILTIFAWKACEINLTVFISRYEKHVQNFYKFLLISIVIASVFAIVSKSRSYMRENRIATPFPADVVDYMVENDINGRIFNEYKAGGYLIYRLSPKSKVYIDGRTEILYPVDHFNKYLNAVSSAHELHAEIKAYGINLALLTNSHENFSLIKNTGDMNLDFVGNRYSLFKTEQANFPLLGTILANPSCFDSKMTQGLANEQTKAIELLPSNSWLSPTLIAYIVDYSTAFNKEAFLSSQVIDSSWTSTKIRLTAYWALTWELNTMAYNLFSKLEDSGFTDYLGAAFSQLKMNDWSKAERVLDIATRVSGSNNPNDISILLKLLLVINEQKQLELFSESYIEGLKVDVENSGYTVDSSLPRVEVFCNSDQ